MTIPVAKCSSCGACANICARGAITMQLDKEGFYRPRRSDAVSDLQQISHGEYPATRSHGQYPVDISYLSNRDIALI